MSRLMLAVLVLLALGASRVVAQDVRYDFDKEKDFSKYKTYKWVQIKDADQPDQLTAKDIMTAVDTELATKGLTKTESDDADLLIAYQTTLVGIMVLVGGRVGMDMEAGCRPVRHTDRLRLFTLGSWTLVCMTRRPSSWCGVGWPPRRSTLKPSLKRKRKISTRRSRNFSRTSHQNQRTEPGRREEDFLDPDKGVLPVELNKVQPTIKTLL
jgi:hypothetical protein